MDLSMVADQNPIIPKTLGIHVLSGQTGESIVVSLPNGKWFVVDAFTGESPGASNGNHAVLSFINRFGLAHDQCLFVLLTHLHQDHYGGIPGLVKKLRKTNPRLPFAASHFYQGDAYKAKVLRILKTQKIHSHRHTGMGRRPDALAELFLKRFKPLVRWQELVMGNKNLGVGVVSPAESIAEKYFGWQEAKNQLADIEVPAPTKNQIKKSLYGELALSNLNKILNNLSVVLCFKVGSSRVLLGADAENESWQELGRAPIAQPGSSTLGNVMNGVCLLKVPHHGSGNTWTPELAGLFSKARYAVVTHNRRGSYLLPDFRGIEQILKTGTTMVVPNKRWLPEEVPQEWRVEQTQVTRISVYKGNSGDKQGADNLNARYPIKCLPSEPVRDELAWASISLDSKGQMGSWYGGKGLAFLKSSDAGSQG